MTNTYEPGSAEIVFSITDAAVATQVSRVTIRRYLDAGRFPNSYRDHECGAIPAPWRISAADLEGAGLRVTEIPTQAFPPREPPPSGTAHLDRRLAELQTLVAVERAIASERLRTIEILTETIRRLAEMTGTRAQPLVDSAPEPQTTPTSDLSRPTSDSPT